MSRIAAWLAWAGVACVAVGMVLAFIAVLTGPAGDVSVSAGDDSTTQAVQGTDEPAPPTDGTRPDDAGAEGGAAATDPAGSEGITPLPGGAGSPGAPAARSGDAVAGASPPADSGGQPGSLAGQPSGPQATASTLTTASVGVLGDRLAATASTAGFAVLALERTDWRLIALDAGGQGASAYIALGYEKGDDYINLSQAPSGTRPSLADAQPIQMRGLTGEIHVLQSVILVRWDEAGTGLLFSTDLPREQALSLIEELRPVP